MSPTDEIVDVKKSNFRWTPSDVILWISQNANKLMNICDNGKALAEHKCNDQSHEYLSLLKDVVSCHLKRI